MWMRIGNHYLNLDNIADVHFLRDADGTLAASVETAAGNVKHYHGREAENLKDIFDSLVSGSTVSELSESAPP
jgi:hypothetical protein